MANSYTEHSKQLRRDNMKKWRKEHREQSAMNTYASNARTYVRKSNVGEYQRLFDINKFYREIIKKLEDEENNG